MSKRTTLVLGLVVAMAIGVAACGSSDDTSTTAAETTSTEAQSPATTDTGSTGGEAVAVTAAADGSLAFDEKTLDATAGTVDLKLDNPSTTEHDVCVRSDSGDELGCSDSTAEGSADLSV